MLVEPEPSPGGDIVSIVFEVDFRETLGVSPFVTNNPRMIRQLEQPFRKKRVDLLFVDPDRVMRFGGSEIISRLRIRRVDVRSRIDDPCAALAPIFETQDVIVRM